jgi:hypothetical protein
MASDFHSPRGLDWGRPCCGLPTTIPRIRAADCRAATPAAAVKSAE